MKKTTLLLLSCASTLAANSQTYQLSDYAGQNDTVYMTHATLAALNFDTTGTGITWDFSALSGNSQTSEIFRNPTQTGYSFGQFPYIYNTNNVNLAQSNGMNIQLGSLQATNPNSYFKKAANQLIQNASAYDIVLGNSSFSVKTTFSSPDVVYNFPVDLNDMDSSNAEFTSSIPTLYYRHSQIKRVNQVSGSGTVITPYGTFGNSLKVESTLTQTDSVSIYDVGYPAVSYVSRELKWLDPAAKYPVLIVKQSLVGNTFVTQSIEYLDEKQYFQPAALFVYLPSCALSGDTVFFQNLSLNGESYSWDFGDPASGGSNQSSLNNPTHIFNTAGDYEISLIVHNGTLADTLELPITVYSDFNDPTISIAALQNPVCPGDSFTFIATTHNGGSVPGFQWRKNGITIDNSGSDTLVVSDYTTGDTISCYLLSSSLCLDSMSALSNDIILNLFPLPQPVISLENDTLSCPVFVTYTWYLDNQEISDADEQNLAPESNGNYTVRVTDSNGCSNTSDVFVFQELGLIAENSDELLLYPNPVTDLLYIQHAASIKRIRITDLTGAVVSEYETHQNPAWLDLTALPAGIYQLTLFEGERNMHQKITKL